MEIERKGGNCIVITTANKEVIVVDPKLSRLGLKDQGARAKVQLLTESDFGVQTSEGTLKIDGPGEYEINDASIKGIAVQSYDGPKGDHSKVTTYRLEAADIKVAIIGNMNPDISENTLEALGVVDVLVIPVGGGGDSLNHTEAVRVTRKIDPKIVIPVRYEEEGAKFETPTDSIDLFINELGAPHEKLNKLRIKSGTITEALSVFELART